jgi:hypothetical protein
MDMRTVLKTFYRSDRLRRVEISEFEVGGVSYFTFGEETWFDYEHESPAYSYWGPSRVRIGGGYYESAEAAEADCLASTPWLRDTNSN